MTGDFEPDGEFALWAVDLLSGAGSSGQHAIGDGWDWVYDAALRLSAVRDGIAEWGGWAVVDERVFAFAGWVSGEVHGAATGSGEHAGLVPDAIYGSVAGTVSEPGSGECGGAVGRSADVEWIFVCGE